MTIGELWDKLDPMCDERKVFLRGVSRSWDGKRVEVLVDNGKRPDDSELRTCCFVLPADAVQSSVMPKHERDLREHLDYAVRELDL